MYNWIESRLRRLEQALESTRAALAKLTAKAAQADQDRMKKPTNSGEDDGSRFVQPTGPVSGGVYPGVIVERTPSGSWVSTGEVIEVLAI